MSGINKVIILGRLGADPEIRYTQQGTPVCNFRMVTSYKSRDGDEQTEWHRVVAWGRLAEVCGEYLSKGRQAYVEGELQTRKWEDKNGVERYTTEIRAFRVEFVGSRGDGAPAQDHGQPAHVEAAGNSEAPF